MNVLLFNVKYSPNLGDGIIAECLESEIMRRTGWHVTSSDLAGRSEWQQPRRSGLRRAALTTLQHLPTAISEFVFESVVWRRIRQKVVPVWRQQVAEADAIVIGGGQLFQDGDLNFPLKIAAAHDVCRAQAKPVGIFAVGVAAIRSVRGQRLFEPLFNSPNLFHASVRDPVSQANLLKRGCASVICRDPGLLAARCWPAAEPPRRNRPVIGLGITHPVVLAHHSENRGRLALPDAIGVYRQIIKELLKSGFDVTCFTNGAGEDENCLAHLKANAKPDESEDQGRVCYAPRARTPEELARLIASFDAVAVHRLHAAIAAYSYGRPVVGLRWDRKLDAFFQSIAEPDRIIDFAASKAPEIARLVKHSLASGHDPVQQELVLSEASEGIAALVEDLHAISADRPRSAA